MRHNRAFHNSHSAGESNLARFGRRDNNRYFFFKRQFFANVQRLENHFLAAAFIVGAVENERQRRTFSALIDEGEKPSLVTVILTVFGCIFFATATLAFLPALLFVELAKTAVPPAPITNDIKPTANIFIILFFIL